MISTESRYAQSSVVTIADPFTGKLRQTIVAGQQVPFTISFTWYQVPAFQRIDQIAFMYYGDGKLWWKIADANPAILDWSTLPQGTLLRIPNA